MHQFKMGQTFKMGQAKSNSKHLQATDLYLVQETWKFLFLTYIYSIVCAYHIGGLFVKCPPYQMATHNLKIHFNFLLWFYIGKYLKCLKEFSHWLRKHVLDSNLWVFAIIDLNQHAFLVLKGVTPTFSNLGILLKIDMKNCPLLGKLLSVWRTVSVLPKSALSAQSAQMVENSHSFFNVSYTWYKSLVYDL